MLKKYDGIISGGVLFAIALFILLASLNITTGADLSVGSDFMPKVISSLLLICSVILIFQGISKSKIYKENIEEKEDNEKRELDYVGVILSLLSLFAYMLIFISLGFFISTILYLFVQIIIFTPKDKRKLLKTAIISVVISLVIYVVFVHGFRLMLPAGILG